MGIGYKWSHLADLPENWSELRSETLEHLTKLWAEQKQTLDKNAQKEFLQKMQREWAIETGLIENLYTLDRGITQTLIEQGLDAIDIPHSATNKPPSYVKRLIKDHETTVEGLFSFITGDRALSTSYIKELHAELTNSQNTTEAIDSMGNHVDITLRKGDWKLLPNNPTRSDGEIHEYCPPEHVASEMDTLVALHLEHVQNGVPPEIEAAWLHHRFTQIHPFQDGNGRVARALATLVFIKAGWFPLVVLNDDRLKYIEALEEADKGDLQYLVEFFAQLAQQSFLKAISICESVLSAQKERKNVLSSIKETLIKKAQQKIRPEQAFTAADHLCQQAFEYIENMASELEAEVADLAVADKPVYSVDRSDEDSWHYFRGQIYRFGRQFDYYVNLEQYHEWMRLQIKMDEVKYNIVLSMHSVSKDFQGVMAAIVFIEFREAGDDGKELAESQVLSTAPFIFTAQDKAESITPKFLEWFEKRILQGLVVWQQKI